MKSPDSLRQKLIQQWLNADHREARFSADFSWPVKLAIGKPSAADFKNAPALVREHVQRWRKMDNYSIEWQAVKYQSASTPVEIPTYWCIHSVSEWLDACNDKSISNEYENLSTILKNVNPKFHCLLIRQRNIWLHTSNDIIIKCCTLALQLKPGIAEGRPLRALSIANIDSKFFENNTSLIRRLLNIIYNNTLQTLSLEKFLDAAEDNQHWLLVVPLDPTLLTFKQLRLRASELAETKLPGENIIVVENERCIYQLPELKNTLAILGAGLNLNWLSNTHLKHKNLAYWGDIDSWGLKMLSIARGFQTDITPLLMQEDVYFKYVKQAVNEPQPAESNIPERLTTQEKSLYALLLSNEKGRLEQEFISQEDVHDALHEWHSVITHTSD